ncbi:hypothetical protein PIB30_077572, partial [Stylosanthes scabra]|nr:hypothetical protein [Stylosanthes scabra]
AGVYGTKQLDTLYYRILVSVVSNSVKYGSFVIASDKDLQVLFHCRKQYPEVRTTELFAKAKDFIASYGGSVPNQTLNGLVGGSSLRNVVAPVLALTASPTFAANMDYDEGCDFGNNRSFGELARVMAPSPPHVPAPEVDVEPNPIEEELREDDSANEEPEIIGGDSDDDIPSKTATGHIDISSFGIQQYPSHFSALNLETMANH